MLNPKTNIVAYRYRQSLCLLTVVAVIASSAVIPMTMAKDPAAGFKVFVMDGAGHETELNIGVSFKVDGSGGRGTRVTVVFSDGLKDSLQGRQVRLKRGGVAVAEAVIQAVTPSETSPGEITISQEDKQNIMDELQKIQQQEWKDLQTLHEEEITDFQKTDRQFQDKLGTGDLPQLELDAALEQQKKTSKN